MIVVLDTNVLLVSFPSKSRYRPIFDVFISSKVSFVITTSIYLEYMEVIAKQAKVGVAEYFKDFLRAAENVITPEVHYHWNLIAADPDDNKFTDAYIAAGADYLVTNDAHFNELKKGTFPPINILSADEFLEIVKDVQ